MCGIAGIRTDDRTIDAVRPELEEAVRRLRHRGPDDRGVWFNQSGVALGHTRLSIIDLSAAGHQPMVSADGRRVIVFNGEIYNHAEIRERLAAAGHAFAGSSDTEVMLHAFEEWGSAAVSQFIGMFAIGLWDEHEQTLELTRDRIGVKPLYYGWHDGTLCFASELKALRAFSHWAPRIDRQALGEFLQYGYISGDRSIYQGVHKLLPGHRLRLKRGHAPIVERYWSVLNAHAAPLVGNDRDLEAELESLLIDAARYRMVADVPVGVYLSGGVDSSLVTAILARHHGHAIRTFTIGFREDTHDESQWARRVAEHCGTHHTEYMLEAPEAVAIAKRWGDLFDEPFGDPSGIPTLLVSQVAGREVKVVLSADGGDELFSGYNSYTGALQRMRKLQRIPPVLSRLSGETLSLIPARHFDAALSAAAVPAAIRGPHVRKLRRLQSMLRTPTIGQIFELDHSYWLPEDINVLLGGYDPPRPSADSYPGTDAERIALWDFHHYLPEDILTKVDRTTMAVSIEGREPLLDHRLAEFAVRLPQHLRRGTLGPKHVLKSILYRYVPRPLLERRKHGFGIPLDSWLRRELRELVGAYLSETRIRAAGIMDWRLVRTITRDFYAGNSKLTTALWFTLAFEMWRERWQ
jgi:asparagine synthase (glutamine-hydrolysing)